VLCAAGELLDEGGWDAVTHVAVAERSGVGRTTIYRHWPESSALVRDVIVDRIRAEQVPPTGTLREDLLAELERYRRKLLDPACQRDMATVIERASVDPAFADVRAMITRAATRPTVEVLRRGVPQGELHAALDCERAVELLAGPLFFRAMLARRSISHRFVEELVDEFLDAHRRAD
jgi:AcrR family transcriptional regulator